MSPAERKVVGWLAGGETGVSSKTMAFAFLGVNYEGYHPLDPSDLGRCLRLIKACPSVRTAIPKLARRSKEWKALWEHWDELHRMMEDEVGIDWSKGDHAPKTYDRMKELGL